MLKAWNLNSLVIAGCALKNKLIFLVEEASSIVLYCTVDSDTFDVLQDTYFCWAWRMRRDEAFSLSHLTLQIHTSILRLSHKVCES
jgi:hypothetical protein